MLAITPLPGLHPGYSGGGILSRYWWMDKASSTLRDRSELGRAAQVSGDFRAFNSDITIGRRVTQQGRYAVLRSGADQSSARASSINSARHSAAAGKARKCGLSKDSRAW